MKSRRTRTRTRRHNGKILTSRSSSPQETRGPPRVPSVPRAAGIGVLGPRTAKAKAGGTTRVTGPGNGLGLAPLSTISAPLRPKARSWDWDYTPAPAPQLTFLKRITLRGPEGHFSSRGTTWTWTWGQQSTMHESRVLYQSMLNSRAN